MEPRDESMRDRLPAQHEPDPEKLARYRKDVEVLMERLRRSKWWKDAARAVRSIRALRDPGRLRPWLYGIARGLAVDRIRSDTSQARLERERALPPDAADASSEESFAAEDAAAVHRALDALDAPHREVLVLHFLEDMALADIAAVVDCPVGTVKSRLFYAKRALREVLLRGGHGTP